jgi:FMN phosphatase YigB (HAD superfamily)
LTVKGGDPQLDQESKLARSGLAELFAGVEILSDKSVESYRRFLSGRNIDPARFVMVGNSLRWTWRRSWHWAAGPSTSPIT